MPFPNAISLTIAAMPPMPTTLADFTCPSRASLYTTSIFALSAVKSGSPPSSTGAFTKYTLLPVFLKARDTSFVMSVTATANEMSDGGTLISLKVPDMLSLPPIAGIPSSS
jgi:hypothetical protein